MIIRIAGEGQYRLPSSHLDKLNELDNEVVAQVAHGDEAAFHKTYDEMVAFIRKTGEAVPANELVTSDVILPNADLSLSEAQKLFVGEGVVPG